MRQIREQIFRLFDKSNAVVVFPTEDAARFFLMQYALSEQRAVRADQALAYDRFRALFLPVHSEKPANSYHRSFFAETHITPDLGLTYFYSPEYPESLGRMRPFIQKCLPAIKCRDNYKIALRHDLDIIYKTYTSFLSSAGLFEAGYEDYVPHTLDKEYYILYPALSPKADELIDFLKDDVHVHVIQTPPEGDTLPSLHEYSNSSAEVRALMREILALLEKGTLMDQIVISTPDFDALRPLLESEAEKRSIPLSFMPAVSVLSTVPGQFLVFLQNLYQGEFSFSALEDLLLFAALPWLDMQENREFLKLLADKNAHSGAINLKADRINDALSRFNVSNPEAKVQGERFLAFYKKLHAVVLKLFEAKDGKALNAALHSFMDNFFLPSQFNDGGLLQDQYAFILNEIDQAEKARSLVGMEVDSFFSVMLRELKGKVYVSRNRGDGIPVYRFGPDVLNDVDYHFVIGLSDALTRNLGADAVFFEPYEEEVHEKEADKADDFFRILSEGSEHLILSYACDSYSGFTLPCEFFVTRSLIVPGVGLSDAYIEGPQIVRGVKAENKCLLVIARSYQKSLLTGLKTHYGASDWSKEGNKGARMGHPSLSFSTIDSYAKCPYRVMAEKLFELKNEEFIPLDLDRALIGTKLHEILQKFFILNPSLDEERKGLKELEDDMERIFDEEVKDWKCEAKAPDVYTEKWIRIKYLPKLKDLISITMGDRPKSKVIATEHHFNHLEDTYSFNGTIDRIDRIADGSVSLVDYKSGKTASKIKNSDQLMLYKKYYMAEHPEETVSSACFYGFSDDKQRYNTYKDEGSEAEAQQKADDDLEATVTGMTEGIWHATPSNDNCQYCSYRSLCRRRFSIV